MRVTNRADKPLADLVPGVRRAIFFDAAEGSAQLSFGAVEIDPGREIPVHRHRIGDRCVEEGFFVVDGEGEVHVSDLAGGVDRFGPGARQFSPGILCYLFIIGKGDDDRSASTQRVFVDVKPVAR